MGGLVISLSTISVLLMWRVFLIVFGLSIENPGIAECDDLTCDDTRASLEDIFTGTIPGLSNTNPVNVIILGLQIAILVVVILFYVRGTT